MPHTAEKFVCPECGQQVNADQAFLCSWRQILALLAGTSWPWIPVTAFALYFGPEMMDWQSGIVLRWIAPAAVAASFATTYFVVRLTDDGLARRKYIWGYMLLFGCVFNAVMLGLAYFWSLMLSAMGC
jgi:hypothetical protein